MHNDNLNQTGNVLIQAFLIRIDEQSAEQHAMLKIKKKLSEAFQACL